MTSYAAVTIIDEIVFLQLSVIWPAGADAGQSVSFDSIHPRSSVNRKTKLNQRANVFDLLLFDGASVNGYIICMI